MSDIILDQEIENMADRHWELGRGKHRLLG